MRPCLTGKGGMEPVGRNPGDMEMRGTGLGLGPKPPSRPRTPRRGKGEAGGLSPLPYPTHSKVFLFWSTAPCRRLATR